MASGVLLKKKKNSIDASVFVSLIAQGARSLITLIKVLFATLHTPAAIFGCPLQAVSPNYRPGIVDVVFTNNIGRLL